MGGCASSHPSTDLPRLLNRREPSSNSAANPKPESLKSDELDNQEVETDDSDIFVQEPSAGKIDRLPKPKFQGIGKLSPSPCNVTVFDWDDTLMCTTDIKLQHALQVQDLRWMEQAVVEALQVALGYGLTVIITNAGMSWVLETAAYYVPAAIPLLKQVRIISARDDYSERWPDDCYEWKAQAFRDLIHGLALESQGVNLISIGDSILEIEAAKEVVCECNLETSVVKTVKLKAFPSVPDISAQLRVLAQQLGMLTLQRVSGNQEFIREASGWTLVDASFIPEPSWVETWREVQGLSRSAAV